MICTAIAEKNFEACMQMVSHYDLAEIRLDLTRFSDEQVKTIFSSHNNLVATCRPDGYDDQERRELLKTAIKSGARYVDVEIESSREFIDDIKKMAAEHDCDLIISYHNYENTPSAKELEAIVSECFFLGAQVAKVACMINEKKDNASILSLFRLEKRIVALGMGELGKITRIVTPLMGAEFTFAAPDKGDGTAPGQITTERMKEIFELLKKNGLTIV